MARLVVEEEPAAVLLLERVADDGRLRAEAPDVRADGLVVVPLGVGADDAVGLPVTDSESAPGIGATTGPPLRGAAADDPDSGGRPKPEATSAPAAIRHAAAAPPPTTHHRRDTEGA